MNFETLKETLLNNLTNKFSNKFKKEINESIDLKDLIEIVSLYINETEGNLDKANTFILNHIVK